MSGALNICRIPDEILTKLKKFRFQKSDTSSAIVFKIIKESQEIAIDEEIEDLDIDELRSTLPDRQPRFVVISYKMQHSDGRLSFPLCLVFSSPLGCNPELQMMYAGSKNNLAKESGVGKEFEIRDLDDLTEEFLLDRLDIVLLPTMSLTSTEPNLPFRCSYCSYSFAMSRALQIHCLANHSEAYIKNLMSQTKPLTLLNGRHDDSRTYNYDSKQRPMTNGYENENRRDVIRHDDDLDSRTSCGSPYRWSKNGVDNRCRSSFETNENRQPNLRDLLDYNANRNKRRYDLDDSWLNKRSKVDERISPSATTTTQSYLNRSHSIRDDARRTSDLISPSAAKLIRNKYLHNRIIPKQKVDLDRCRRRVERTPYFPIRVHGVKHLSEVTIYCSRGIDDLLKNLSSKSTKLFRQCDPAQFSRQSPSSSPLSVRKNIARFKRRSPLKPTYERNYRPDSPTANWVTRNQSTYRIRGRMYDYRLRNSQRTDECILQNVAHLFCTASMAGEVPRTKFEMFLRQDAPDKEQPSLSNVHVQALLECFYHRKNNNYIQNGV